VLTSKTSLVNTILLLVSVVVCISDQIVLAQVNSGGSDVVWHWYGDCETQQQLAGRVLIDGSVGFEFVFPICPRTRSQIGTMANDQTLTFTFREERAHFGPTLQKAPIRVDIWKAGGEPGALILGVSFLTNERVLLNTVHIAMPDRLSRFELARGVAVETAPSGVALAEAQRVVAAMLSGDISYLTSIVDATGIVLGTDGERITAKAFQAELAGRRGAHCVIFGCSGGSGLRAEIQRHGPVAYISRLSNQFADVSEIEIVPVARLKDDYPSPILSLSFLRKRGRWRLIQIEYT
jgi:hypothetical protein